MRQDVSALWVEFRWRTRCMCSKKALLAVGEGVAVSVSPCCRIGLVCLDGDFTGPLAPAKLLRRFLGLALTGCSRCVLTK